MLSALRGLTLLCATAIFAQAPAIPPPQQTGLLANWDIAPILQEIGSHAQRLSSMLSKLDPHAWVERGASDTYVAQLTSSREQAEAVAVAAKALAANPQKLSANLELLFRIHGMESMNLSLTEAIRKYQSAADAQALIRLAAENGANRDRLQNYVVNLAAEREQDLAVMDREAQRCRGLMTQPAPPNSGRKK
jgi:hypothetical protein